MRKLLEEAVIITREEVAGQTFRMRLDCPGIAKLARAGQFVMLRVREGNDPLLRRPFSFHRIFAARGQIEILYKVAGRGTLILSQLPPGSRVGVAGPLGNGFQLPLDRTVPLALIAGGIGIAPLCELLAQIASERTEKELQSVHLFYGARTASELLPEGLLDEFGITTHWATDDGSFAYNGLVTRFFESYFETSGSKPAEMYSCGPLAMQYRVAGWALANAVPAQLSLESLMACGIGACLGCALPAATPEDPTSDRYVHVCENGPIFSAGSIQWSKIQVQQMPRPTCLFS
jgi:dihydroorotate dehydrogenase electron transfer subunit